MLRLAFLIACCPSSIRLSICLPVCKLFIFPSSSPELLGQFQPSLAQSIFGLWNLQIIHITGTHTDIVWFFRHLKWVGSVLSRSELDPFLYILFHTVQTQNRLSPVVKGDSSFCKWRAQPFLRGGNYKIAKIYWRNFKIFLSKKRTLPISTTFGTTYS